MVPSCQVCGHLSGTLLQSILTTARQGKILGIGADWGLSDSKGTFSPDTRYQLQTTDGANIFIQTSGPAQSDGTIYLRAVYETGHPDYYWLNNIIAVGVLRAGNNTVAIDMFQMGTD